MALDGGTGIDIERRADLFSDFRQAYVFSVKNAVAIFKMIHGKQSQLDQRLEHNWTPVKRGSIKLCFV